jgi:SNF2 family DNA or RNA helicase
MLKPDAQPQPHQQDMFNMLAQNNGRGFIASSVGSGKTFGSIYAVEKFGEMGRAKNILVITPASLKENYKGNIDRFTEGNTVQTWEGSHRLTLDVKGNSKGKNGLNFFLISYELFRRNPDNFLNSKLGPIDTIVADEIHRAKNFNSETAQSLIYGGSRVTNFIGMTGTLSSNTPAEVIPVMAAITGKKFKIGNPKEFNANFIKTINQRNDDGSMSKVKVLKNVSVLKDLFKGSVYYMDPSVKKLDMPDKVVEWVPIKMSEYQKTLYQYALKDIDPSTRKKIEAGIPVNPKQAKNLLIKLLKARQVSNGIHTIDTSVDLLQSAEQTPKIRAMVNDITQHLDNNPNGQALVFTNNIVGGIDVMAAALKARGIKFGVFAGKDVPGGDYFGEASRPEAITSYNKGKTKVLIISPAGAEGLDLPNTTFIGVMDPHYNPERILQMEARGVRLKGLGNLPQEQRKVLVRRYYNVVSKTFFQKILNKKNTKTVDEWVYSIASNKSKLNNEFRELIKTRGLKRAPIKLLQGAPNVELNKVTNKRWFNIFPEKGHRFESNFKTNFPPLGINEMPTLNKKWLITEPPTLGFSSRDPRNDKGVPRGKYKKRREQTLIEQEKQQNLIQNKS